MYKTYPHFRHVGRRSGGSGSMEANLAKVLSSESLSLSIDDPFSTT